MVTAGPFPPGPAETAPRRGTTPLRGRDDELDTIGQLLSALRWGAGSTLTIVGEPGVGKTRLVAETGRIANRNGVRFAYAAADPRERAVPLSLLMGALFDGDDPPLDRSQFDQRSTVPEQRYWLLRELGLLLEETAREVPLCICLDDLHWADEGTIGALRALARRLVAAPVLWIGAARLGQASAPLRATLSELQAVGAHRLELEPLDPTAARAVVSDILGAEATSELLEITDSAGGIPYFLQELTFGLLDEELVKVEDGEVGVVERRLPGRVKETMLQRLARLSDGARRTALIASVLGREFTFEDLALMREVSPGALLDPVEELTCADILVEADSGFAFRHDITRQAVFESVPPAARRALERQAVEVLLSGGALAMEVATQLMSSAEPGDGSAVATLRQAAQSLATSDPGVASDLSVRALELTADEGPERATLVVETALLLHAAGRAEEARQFVDTKLRRTFVPSEEARIRLSIAGMPALSPAVRAETGRAALALPELPLGLRAAHLARLIHNLLVAGRSGEAIALLEDAADLVARADCPEATFALNLAKGGLASDAGEFESALRQIRSAASLGKATGDLARKFLAEEWVCEVLVHLDRTDDALQICRELLTAAERGHQTWELRVVEAFRARLFLMLGRLADSTATIEDRFSFEDADAIVGVQDAAALVTFGRASLHAGNEPGVRRASQIASRLTDYDVPAVKRHAIWLLAVVAMARGNVEAARAYVRGMGEEERLTLLPLFPPDVTDEIHLARIALATDDQELALAAADDAEERARNNPGVASIAGTDAHVRGMIDDDVELLSEAVTHFERSPRPLALASALEEAGAALARRHSRDDAVANLGRALEVYASIGAVSDESRVRGRLRKLGVRRRLVSQKRAETGWDALTGSELAVVRLVASGMTNRQVAGQLYLSHHTVGTHLRHAYAKLGVNSRVELTRIAIARNEVATQP
jgi:DNA-binding CsgD family transcriptional regulator